MVKQSKQNGAKPARKLRPFKTYRFIDKDPVIDKLRTAFKDSKLSEHKVALASGVSASCYQNWFRGGTRRPQFCTIEATARALGKTFKLVDDV